MICVDVVSLFITSLFSVKILKILQAKGQAGSDERYPRQSPVAQLVRALH